MAGEGVIRNSVAATSPDLRKELITQLMEIAPEAFADGKLDLERLKALVCDAAETGPERYTFSWAGKREAVAMLQAPTGATLLPDPERSVNFDDAQHIFIEGENLEVLKVLYRSYYGRVRLIYIDPPYNTGNDFIYPDDFSSPLDHYLRMTGQKDHEGNYTTSKPDRTGRLHSAWLTMMYPRLSLARQLLAKDGVICVSIDDGESANLKLLMNQIFGEENFISTIVWQKRYVSNVTAKHLSDMHDFIHVYAKDLNFLSINDWPRNEEQLAAYKNPDNDPRGRWRAQDLSASKPYRAGLFTIIGPTGQTFDPPPNRYWRCNEKVFKEWRDDDRIWWGVNNDTRPMLKAFLEESERDLKPHTWWDYEFAGHNKEATLELKALFGGSAPFDTPKPVKLLCKLIETFGSKDGFYLDFFAGSGTLGQAVLEANASDGGSRRSILVQFPERTGRTDLKTIADIMMQRMRLIIEELPEAAKAGMRAFKLAPSNILRWAGVTEKDADTYANQLDAFADTLVEGWKPENVIWEAILREGYSLTSRVELLGEATASTWRVTDPEREQNFTICLADRLSLAMVAALKLDQDDLFVCRDTALDDSLAANLALQCRLKVL